MGCDSKFGAESAKVAAEILTRATSPKQIAASVSDTAEYFDLTWRKIAV